MISVRGYYAVFAALLVLTLTTAGAAYVDFGGAWNAVIALILAAVKTTLVVLFFMHLKYSSPLTWLFASSGLFWIVILLLFTLSDYLTR